MDLPPRTPDAALPAEFSPTAGFSFEAELREMPPRKVPAEFRNSPFFKRQRNTAAGLFMCGMLCLVCGQLPIFKEWGLYLLPLACLNWIGLALLVIGVVTWIASKVRKGPLRYVEEGVPVVARIRELVLRPSLIYNGQPTRYVFSAMLEHPDPATGNLVVSRADSRDFSVSAKSRYRTSFRVGDYVTAVYLKDNPVKTLRLYGFLELRPDLGLLRIEPGKPSGPLQTVLGVTVIFAMFVVLFWNLYAFSKYQPLELTFARMAPPFAVGGIVLGGSLAAWLISRRAHERRQVAARNAQARAAGEAVELEAGKRGLFGAQGILMSLIIGAGAILLGGVIVLCWCDTANALLDKSKPQLRPVEIVEFWSTTHSFLFREYEIEYRFVGEDEKRKLMSTPVQMGQFQSKRGLAEIHAGFLGWPWVKTITPLEGGGSIN